MRLDELIMWVVFEGHRTSGRPSKSLPILSNSGIAVYSLLCSRPEEVVGP